jgi:hypothetical protein
MKQERKHEKQNGSLSRTGKGSSRLLRKREMMRRERE